MSLVEAIEWTQSILGVKEGAILISLAEVGMEMRLEGKSTDERTGKFVLASVRKFCIISTPISSRMLSI